MSIKEQLESHLKWINEEPDGRMFKDCGDLTTTDLIGANLTSVDLRYANLKLFNLTEAGLSNADLRHTNLRLADLIRADLSYAQLHHADLSCANLTDADLRYAGMSHTYLRNADLTGANLTGANLKSVDLTGADLTNADIRGADLTGADLTDIKGKVIHTFQTTQHFAFCADGYITIGCKMMTIERWMKEYEGVGEYYEYTEKEIREYGDWIKSMEEVE